MLSDATNIWIRGHPIASLMSRTTFVGTVFLLHRGRLPTTGEERLLNAVLVAGADDGSEAPSCAASRLAASGNRQSAAAAVAAGMLAIGDGHDGAATRCMEAIDAIMGLVGSEYLPPVEAARRYVERERDAGRQVPGLGHRARTHDPRVDALLDAANQEEVAGDGIAAMRALEMAASRLIEPRPLNIVGAIGAVLYDLGFPAAAGNLIVILGRVAGLTAEVLEEYTREQPMPITIPVEYDGVPPVEDGGPSS